MTATFSGEEAPEGWGHVGWPVDPADVLERARRGLSSYWPTDPRAIDQTGYRRFAETRGKNSE